MADPKSQKSAKPKATKKPKGPKFSARLVRDAEVLKVRTAFKFHSSSYEAAAFLYANGDAAPAGKGSRAENELVDTAVRPTYAEAEAAAKEFVAKAIEKGFVPQEKSGKRTPVGWDAL